MDAFVRYSDVVSAALGGRVKNWITHNEPWVAAHLGHGLGLFAPGIADFGSALTAGHHLLLSHGRAVPTIRSNSSGAKVGIALDCRPSQAASDNQGDIAANTAYDGFRNRWFFDPVFGKGYPEDAVRLAEERGAFASPGLPFAKSGDVDEIAVPIDFLGLNYYTSVAIGAGDETGDDPARAIGTDQPEGYTEKGWAITPDAFVDFLRRLDDEYGPQSIVITENGASYSDGPGSDGRIRDRRRIDYLDVHLRALTRAIERGVPVDGYFVWSLLDNLEWVDGYSQRFGLIWVDHATGERIPKDSFDWYRRVIARGLGER